MSALVLSHSFLAGGNGDEGAAAATSLQRLYVERLGQGMRQGLPPGLDRETRLVQQPFDVLCRVKARLSIKDAFMLVLEVIPAQRAVAVNEADHEYIEETPQLCWGGG